MFKCILCLKPTRNQDPIALTKKVNDRVTLEECIRLNLPCADVIINEYDINQHSCTNCFLEFVNFYEFLGKVEDNYGWNFQNVQVKQEIEQIDNFVDITQIFDSNPNVEDPVILQNCSVRLQKINQADPKSLKIETIKQESQDEPTIEPITKIEECGDDSDFEWPQNDEENTSWSLPNDSTINNDEQLEKSNKEKKEKRTTKKKYVESEEDEYEPYAAKRKSSGYIRYLPRDKVTPEILATKGDYITIDGLEYRIPRRNRHKPIKEKNPELKSLERNRRPHRAYDTEGEQKILNSIEVKCHECGEKFDSFFRVRKHFKRFHPEQKGYLICCERKFTRRYELLEHLEFHDKSVVHRCQICNNGKDYKSASSLRMHIKVCHLKIYENVQFMCEDCGKIFKSKYALQNHLDSSHSSKKFECFICHKDKPSMISLKKHLENYHGNKETGSIVCHICSRMVKENYIKTHMKLKHSEEGVTRVKCKLCDHWLTPFSMPAHMLKHNNQGVSCPHCGKHLKHKYSLTDHIKRSHSGDEKKHECTTCGKKFYKAVKLKEHVAVAHTREYPWACRVCGRQFRAEANWKKHEKREHPEEYERLFKPHYMRAPDDPFFQQKNELSKNPFFPTATEVSNFNLFEQKDIFN